MNKLIHVQLGQIRLNLNEEESDLLAKAAKVLGINEKSILEYHIRKMSLDARKKNDIHYRATLEIVLPSDFLKKIERCDTASLIKEEEAVEVPRGNVELRGRPVVVGAGPCGLFAALLLAQEGYKPIVIEQGKAIAERVQDVNLLFEKGSLDPQSNVLFGEGGAGTFSDGKLTWRGKDFRGKIVLENFVDCGAPKEILYQSKAHIGTDLLRSVIVELRKKIISLGGSFHFGHKVDSFDFEKGELSKLYIKGKDFSKIESNACILALGHSARNSFETLFAEGLAMEAKAFAVGFRVEHPQEMIDQAQYGEMAGHPRLPAAEYRLSETVDGRGVYSFCMCPGGQVVCSASEEKMLCCNGMSEHARAAENANAAIIVQVGPKDFGEKALDGIAFQRHWEKTAFELGGGNYHAPMQCLGDFLNKRPSQRFGAIKPSYLPGGKLSDLSVCLPKDCVDAIAGAFSVFGRRIKGFDRPDAVLTGVETRSSSPLRLLRGQDGQSISHQGIFPAGEGAGYAGGIMSAAVDGLRAAESLIRIFEKPSA